MQNRTSLQRFFFVLSKLWRNIFPPLLLDPLLQNIMMIIIIVIILFANECARPVARQKGDDTYAGAPASPPLIGWRKRYNVLDK